MSTRRADLWNANRVSLLKYTMPAFRIATSFTRPHRIHVADPTKNGYFAPLANARSFWLMLPHRPLGTTGLDVSRIGLGLAALGRPGYINLGHSKDLEQNYAVQAMERRAHQVLDAAYAAGVRYFDAARSYGRAEAFLGSWLTARKIPPDVRNNAPSAPFKSGNTMAKLSNPAPSFISF